MFCAEIHLGACSDLHKKIKLTLSYDGTCYQGWQRQKSAPTIQQVLEEKLGLMTREQVRVTGSGRTDAGVHAEAQVCHFTTRSEIPLQAFKKGLNSLLPQDILVRRAEIVPFDFHAQFNALSKTYEYRILNTKDPDVFLRRYVWHLPLPLDTDSMQMCLKALVGRHDFSSFRSAGGSAVSPVRTVLRAQLESDEQGLVRLVFEADGFLRHMVRNIVGTVVAVGTGRISPERFMEIMEAGDRREAGIKAPSKGLFLMSVRYPDHYLPGSVA